MSSELIEHSDRANDLKGSVKISDEWLQLLKDKFEKIPAATKNLQAKIEKLNWDLPENTNLSPTNTVLRNQIKSEINWLNEKAQNKTESWLKALATELLPTDILKWNDIVIINGKVTLVPRAPIAPKQQGSYKSENDIFAGVKRWNWNQLKNDPNLAEEGKTPEWQAVAELRNYWIPFTVNQNTGKITVNWGNNTNLAGWKSAFNNAQIEATADANKRNPQTAQN